MKTQIKHTADGTAYTQILKPFEAEWVKGQLAMGNYPLVSASNENEKHSRRGLITNHINSLYKVIYSLVDYDCLFDNDIENIIINLPALPRYPKPEDAGLLHEYMAQGLYPFLRRKDKESSEGEFVGNLGSLFQIKWIGGRSRLISASELILLGALNYKSEKCEVAITDADGNRHEIAIIDNTTSGKE